MASTRISIRMDSELKKQFKAFCEDIGMSMTTAFTIYAKKAVCEHRIPFEFGEDNLNAETLAAIEEVRKLKQNPNKKTYGSFLEILEDLND